MKVVVAGGTGFLGRPLVAALTARGDAVTVLSRGEAVALPPAARSLRWLTADADEGAWRRAVAAADAVVNLAGTSLADRRWTPSHKERILQSRLRATGALVAAMADGAAGPRTLVSASAVGYYGACGDEPISDADPPAAGSDFLAGVCIAWEAAAREAESLGARVVLLRTGLVLGADGGALARLAMPFRLFVGGPLGDGRQWLPWIHRDDAVALVRHTLERDDLSGPVHVTAPTPVTNRAFATALGRALRRPAFLPAPGLALRLALGEMADALLLAGQRALPDRAVESGFAYVYGGLDAALADLVA